MLLDEMLARLEPWRVCAGDLPINADSDFQYLVKATTGPEVVPDVGTTRPLVYQRP